MQLVIDPRTWCFPPVHHEIRRYLLPLHDGLAMASVSPTDPHGYVPTPSLPKLDRLFEIANTIQVATSNSYRAESYL